MTLTLPSAVRRLSLSAKVMAMIVASLAVLAAAIWFATILKLESTAVDDANQVQARNMHVAWSVLDQYGKGFAVENGRLRLGGRVLNGFSEPVDRIQALVGGNATIFLGDERVATTVRKPDGSRAVGTKMAPEVRDIAIVRGLPYHGKADIVGVPHFTAYDPIRDGAGHVVGALLVGVPVDQFMRASRETGASIAEASLLISLVAGFLCFLVARLMFRPLGAMTEAMQQLSAGRYGIAIPGEKREDEIGRMAAALAVFRDAGIAKEKAEAAAREEEAARTLVVETLHLSLESVSAGDLAQDVTADFPPAYRGLKANFNSALASLRDLIGSVLDATAGLRTGAGEIAQASEDLARRTENNAASLEETSAALAQIDDRLKAGAAASQQTVQRADQALATVDDGRSTAGEAVGAMGRVSESAKGIDDVIEGLDKIAFQTRVLAMNAAVEAGRAGEAGRGFAVVADLVSALAMRAEEEAKRARDQLTVTQSEIVSAVDAVRKVDGSLQRICDDVGEVHGLLGRMAADNQAQAAAISQISAAVGAMDQATQQNAAMVEESSAAARNLSNEVESLAVNAARFRIGAGPARLVARAASPARPAPLTAAAPAKPTRRDAAEAEGWSAF